MSHKTQSTYTVHQQSNPKFKYGAIRIRGIIPKRLSFLPYPALYPTENFVEMCSLTRSDEASSVTEIMGR